MRRLPANTFDRPWLLLCEGVSDKRFFDQLIRCHNISPDQFDVYFPSRYGQDGGGRGKFGPWLSTTYETSESFRENVKAVLIVSDNDDDPAASFAEVQAGSDRAAFGAPNDERIVAQKNDHPFVIVLMIPMDEPGNLETLCVLAAYNKWNLREPLNNYVSATPASDWRLGKQSKMRIQAILAATCETKPDTTLANHWQEREEFHIPLDDPAFNEIVRFLRGFEVLVAQGS